MNDILGKSIRDFVEEFKQTLKTNTYLDHHLNRINSYDELINYLNGDYLRESNKELSINCQPITHELGGFGERKFINKSNCVLYFKLTNLDTEMLEDYKLYLNFFNVVKADSLKKNRSGADFHRYRYNVRFFESNKAEFLPDRNILVQNDSVLLDAICFRPDSKAKSVKLHWELFARNVYSSGNYEIKIKAKFVKFDIHKYVDNANDLKKQTRILPK